MAGPTGGPCYGAMNVNNVVDVLDTNIGSEALARIRETGVLVPEFDNVYSYLRDHREMIGLVEELAEPLLREFHSDSQLSLELYRDRESDDHYLTIYVRQHSYQPTLFERIDSVVRQFDQQLSKASGWLQVTTDFLKPR